MTTSRRLAPLPLLLVGLAVLAALALIPRVVQAQSQTPDENAVVWSADMLVVEYTANSIGAASADLFSNIGGTGDLEIRSLWSHVPNRDIRLAFQEGIPDADDLTLVVGDLTLEFPPGSSGNGSFKWADVDVDWEDGQTISVSIVLTSALQTSASNTPATGAPTISGTAQVGETLTAEASGIADDDGLDGASYSYQWTRSDGSTYADLTGETDSAYTLVFADQGKTIKVRVSFTDDADNEETLTSEATVEVAAAPNRPATGAPTISGTPQVDQTLTAGTSDIADEDGVNDVSYSYQWMADDVNIDGATGSTYVLANADAGKAISVRVSFTDDRNNAEARTSVATAAVLPTVPTQPLSLNVTPGDQIQELDASWQAPSSNGGSSITGYRVQWKRFADSWDTEADVSQATVTGTTHTIPELTGGVEYAVRVVASNTAGDGSASDEVTGTPAGGTSHQQTGDSTTPTVSSIAITSDPGSDEVYAIGDAIQITVTFSADVTVTGKPQLELDIGGNAKPAEYQSTNASSTVFNYTVAEGDSDTDGIAVAENKLTLNGGTIKDASDNAADLDHVALEARPGHKVDGVRPTISSVRMSGTRLNVGDLIHVSVDFTEEIFLDGSPHITLDIDSGSRVASLSQIHIYCPALHESTSDPLLAVIIPEGEEPPPGVTSYCFWSDTHGITMLFHHTVAKGELDTDGVGIPANSLSLNGGTLRDAAGNDAVITHEAVADDPLVLIDGVPPEITSIEITSDPGEDDTYAEGDTIKFNVTFSEDLEFFGFGWTRLRLDIGGKTRMAYGVKRDILDIRSDETGYIMAYSYTVAAGDNDEDGISFPANALHKIWLTVKGTDGNHSIFEYEAIADDAEHKVATATTAEDDTDDTQKTGFLMISGTLNVGETVNADFSNVDDEDGVEYAMDTAYFDWSREGGGGLHSRFDTRYIIAASDKGKRLRVSTWFFDDNGNEEYLTSPWTEPVGPRAPSNSDPTGLPTISGTAQVGETLTADTATIADEDGLTNVSYSYQWIRNDGTSDADIGGQTDSTYTLVAADQGNTIKVKVTFTDDDDNAETLTSVTTEAVAAAPNSSATGLPTISGTAPLTAAVVWETKLKVWAPSPPANTWPRVVGWTSNFAGGNWLGTVSSRTFTFEDNDYEVVQLLVDRDTSTLSLVFEAAKDGAKEDRDMLRLRLIEGTAEHTYDLADATTTAVEHPRLGAFTRLAWSGVTDTALGWAGGDSITVKMESTDAGADGVASTPNSPATGRPSITGPAQVGEILTADTSGIADADGLDAATFRYQWIRNEDVLIVDIADATGSTYTPTGYDLGRLSRPYLMVRVSFTDDAGNDESLTSAPFGTLLPAPPGDCPGSSYDPAPVDVAVGSASVQVNSTAIVVDSTTDDYFVLYVQPDLDSDREIVASVTLGQEDTTVLTEPLSPLPREHYRVEKYLVADPADVDGDCIDDITELDDPVKMNPVNPAPAVPFDDGVVAVPDRETFETIIAGDRVNNPNLQDLPFLIFGHQTDRPAVYFSNTETHYGFIYRNQLIANWRYWEGRLFGEIVYHPDVLAPNGELGVYVYSFGAGHVPDFATVALAHEVLAASMPLLDNDLAYRPISPRQRENYDRERTAYDDSRVDVLLEEDILRDVDFIPFNREEGYGFLRVMSLEERPNPRDIVIYEALPNELSRVAGIITTVAQTPLAHVNLRAVQDGVPNAFIRDALDNDGDIADLIGSFVHYAVTEDGYSISAATRAEVDAHFSDSRPAQTQTPERDLTITEITDLDDIGFDDWDAFGVKAANVAVLRTLGFPDGTVPDGFAVPFYFYDEFMKHNEFYEDIEDLLADPDFQSDFDTQESELKKLRKKIKKGESPQWMIDALVAMHATFPEGQSLRYRSSTNNEDLPGFSGAGLYDSKTQKPDETAADGIDKSLKQVFASMWNFRAFTEREFHRIDHLAAAMGVLVHPNFSDELANGVAVTFNPIVGGVEGYYVNTQLGEDLVTNPEALSVPEEVLLHEPGKYPRDYEVLATSNRVEQGKLLMSDAQMDQLRRHLEVIHDDFAELYGIEAGEKFAMEIEFKITSENVLSIKQARPWVFSHVEDNSEATGKPTISGTAQVDETLTAETSDISDADGLTNVVFSYQWIRSESGTDTDIQNATGSTYTLGIEDEGKTVKVMVSFTDDAGNEETLTSEGTEAVAPNPNSPATGLPTISGTAQVDETLTAETSDISDADGLTNVVFSYQWIRSESGTDTDISDETSSTYVLSWDDQGKTVKVMVSFTDDAGNQESLTSAATDSVAPSPLVWSADMSVVDLGNGAIGATRSDLFSNEGGSANLQAKWLWYYTPGRYLRLAFTEIVPGAEELTLQIGDVSLTLQAGDSNFTWDDVDVDWEDGQVIRARVVLTSATMETQPNTPATGLPTIIGTAQEDEALTVDVSSIADADGLSNVSYSYQWIRNDGISDTDIAGQTDSAHTLTADDAGKAIKVRVSFTDDADNEETLTSEATVSVAAAPNRPATGAPTITGTPQVEHTLTAGISDIADEDGLTNVSYRYQWIRNDETTDTDIQGATSSTYTLSDADEGKTIKVRASFTDDAGHAETATSGVTNAVVARSNSPATGLPTISGTAQVGEVLTADTSGTADADGLTSVSYSYQWVSNDGNTDTDIAGQTDSTYTLVAADVGKTIKVRVSFTDDAENEESLTSAATAAVTAKANTNTPATGAPTIGGTPQVDQTLTADTANIADEDGLTNVSYRYQWMAGGSDIAGATGSSYTLTSSEEGQTVQVRVTFTDDADNEETLTSAPTVEVQQGSNAWSATMTVETRDGYTGYSYWGNPHLGSLSETEVEWDGKTHHVKYILLKDSDLWLGLNEEMFSTGFVLSVGDEEFGSADARVDKSGASYRFLWDDRGLGWSDGQEVSVNLVESEQNTPALGPPTITGTPQVGETLTADTSGVEDADGLTNVSYSYQWVADDTDIGGATGSSYTLTSSEQGQTVQVRVSFTDDADNEETLTSAATDAVVAAANTSAAGAPTISGTPQVEQTLTADTSSITDEDGLTNVSYSYQWIAGGSDIGGATGSTYTLTASEQGQTIQVRVSFTDDADNEETLTSVATVAVAAAPNRDATGAPTIGGTPQVDQTLTADTANIADEDGLTNVSYRYQWMAEGSDIAGATGSSYTLTSSEEGQTVQVRVTFTDDADNDESLTSVATDAVVAAPVPLTVRLKVAAPTTHDGSSEFTFEIEFSEEFGLSYVSLKNHAFNVTGGSVKRAQRTDKPSNISWLITVKPQGNGDVTIVLPVTTDCNADGAICTGDGRKLSNSLSFTVSGPDQ